MASNIICFLTVKPSELFYDFCKKLKNDKTDIYICIDNNNYCMSNYNSADGIKIIQLDNKICELAGFKSCVLTLRNRACSRDKALYYFCKNNINYNHLWLIEEDVFIPNIYTIENINNKYLTGDLLTRSNDIIYQRQTNWHWGKINNTININPPYSSSMICACRVSKKMMNCINDYATKYGTLFLDEALFNTLAVQSNLNIITPIELSTIEWRKDWKKNDINPYYLYHPIKDIKVQYAYRK